MFLHDFPVLRRAEYFMAFGAHVVSGALAVEDFFREISVSAVRVDFVFFVAWLAWIVDVHSRIVFGGAVYG